MNREIIDYWLRYFDKHDIFQIDFTEPGYGDFLQDLETVGFENPIQLLGALDRAISI